MLCAYCGQEAKGTKEHIISCAILDLFPECFLTIDNTRGKVHLGDPVIKDICGECNNEKLSYIDAYAKAIISKYFLKKYQMDDVLAFTYEYSLIQKMLLKYAYNDLRSHNDDTSFFTEDVLEYIKGQKITKPLKNVTVLSGLAINTSPAHDHVFGNMKIRWSKDPLLLSNSIIENVNYDTGKTTIRSPFEIQKFTNMRLSYVFRFNSVQFLLFAWDEDISNKDLEVNNVVLQCQYPYSVLNDQGQLDLSRCTSETTYHFERLIDVTWGQGLLDSVTWMRGTYSEKSQKYLKDIEAHWQKEEQIMAEEHPR